MRKLLLAVAVVLAAGCGSVTENGPEQGMVCPATLPADCVADPGTVKFWGGQPATVMRCGSMVAFVIQEGAPPNYSIVAQCCVDNVPPGTTPDINLCINDAGGVI